MGKHPKPIRKTTTEKTEETSNKKQLERTQETPEAPIERDNDRDLACAPRGAAETKEMEQVATTTLQATRDQETTGGTKEDILRN